MKGLRSTAPRTHRLDRLRTLRQSVVDVLSQAPAQDPRAQLHPCLSPSAWHIGHTHFVEALWLRRHLLGQADDLDGLDQLYIPEACPKHTRGARLPASAQLLDWCRQMARRADAAWTRAYAEQPRHGMLGNDYLLHFIQQHYAQHRETLRMIQQVAALAQRPPEPPRSRLVARPPRWQWQPTAAVRLQVGELADTPAPYDNELGAHAVQLSPHALARQPVSNGQWLAFMDDGGYERPDLWSDRGWAWRGALEQAAPHHWRHGAQGWTGIQADGHPDPLDPDAPVMGISWYEAQAFTQWSGTRLPHELEWLHAARTGRLAAVGQVWEWMANPLYAFPGYRDFPYPGYTLPWCDGRHFVLKGGSRWTEPDIRRPSFRNFYTADMRHIFAGLRVAARSPVAAQELHRPGHADRIPPCSGDFC
ncbi:MAG: SUMF1/EgtB/PvdO family nonheme iron enzyme [Pseudomonadota bacterium]|nr:SUMF1/EgtB/PvdO family nonheme iron enzyme [Pseudomonadota bacterium]